MISTPRRAFIGLLIFNVILVFIVVHLMFFAAQGRRYTGDHGDSDRAASIARDTNLAVQITEQVTRIGNLERKVAEHTHDNLPPPIGPTQ